MQFVCVREKIMNICHGMNGDTIAEARNGNI